MKRTVEAAILAAGLVIGFTIFGIFFFQTRSQNDTISVVGSATKRFEADIVKWRITFGRTAELSDLQSGYVKMQRDLQLIRDQLKQNNISEQDLTLQPVTTNPNYSQYGQISSYNLTQNIFLISKDIPMVEKMALNPSKLFEEGIILHGSYLEYYNSNIADIKRELLAEATKDARARAEEIAKNSGVSIAKVMAARVGVFQITEPYSTEISDYGMYSTSTRVKDITVTVRVTFGIN